MTLYLASVPNMLENLKYIFYQMDQLSPPVGSRTHCGTYIMGAREAITLGPLLGNTLYVMFVESDLGVNIGRQPAYIVHSSSSLKTRLPHCSSKLLRPFHPHQKDHHSQGRFYKHFLEWRRYVTVCAGFTAHSRCDTMW